MRTKTLGTALTVAGALFALSACVSPDEVSSLEDRVGELERRANAAEARASELEAAANQCTATCEEVQTRTERMFQESMRK